MINVREKINVEFVHQKIIVYKLLMKDFIFKTII